MPLPPNIALPVLDLLVMAILDHKFSDPAQRLPRRIVMHPGTRNGLLRDERLIKMYRGNRDWRDETILGVPVVWDESATRPKLITADNLVEYL